MTKKTNERAKGPKAWIRERTEEEPVDFLDPEVVQRVVGKLRLFKSLENPCSFRSWYICSVWLPHAASSVYR